MRPHRRDLDAVIDRLRLLLLSGQPRPAMRARLRPQRHRLVRLRMQLAPLAGAPFALLASPPFLVALLALGGRQRRIVRCLGRLAQARLQCLHLRPQFHYARHRRGQLRSQFLRSGPGRRHLRALRGDRCPRRLQPRPQVQDERLAVRFAQLAEIGQGLRHAPSVTYVEILFEPYESIVVSHPPWTTRAKSTFIGRPGLFTAPVAVKSTVQNR